MDTPEKIANACAIVGDILINGLEHPYTLKKVTFLGKAGFRFTMIVEVDGEKLEVQVRNWEAKPNA